MRAMTKISADEARAKYGIVTDDANSRLEYRLTPSGCVVDSDGDMRYYPPVVVELCEAIKADAAELMEFIIESVAPAGDKEQARERMTERRNKRYGDEIKKLNSILTKGLPSLGIDRAILPVKEVVKKDGRFYFMTEKNGAFDVFYYLAIDYKEAK